MFKKINKEIHSFLKNKNLNNPEERQEIEKSWEENIEEKTREVEEKLKKKKKLTTEDLLVFQKQKPRKW